MIDNLVIQFAVCTKKREMSPVTMHANQAANCPDFRRLSPIQFTPADQTQPDSFVWSDLDGVN